MLSEKMEKRKMMCHSPILFDEDNLGQRLVNYRKPRFLELPLSDRYLAMSVFQKAVRRNEVELALSAGEFLRHSYPNHFWKRLQIIALEDVGLANQELVAQVMFAAPKPLQWGVPVSAEKVACFLIEELCGSPKDRATDDLFDFVSRDPGCAINCANLADSAVSGDSAFQFADDPFGRALSLIPPSQLSGEFPDCVSRPDEWVVKIEQSSFSVPLTVVGIAKKAVIQTRSILAPMLVALAPEFPDIAEQVDDDLLPVLWHRGIPTWACGQHTRVGLAGLRDYARRSKRAGEILKAGKTGQVSASKVLGGLLFRIECGQLSGRVNWDLGSELKSEATKLGWGLGDQFVFDLIGVMIDEWDLLNECRLDALQNYLR